MVEHTKNWLVNKVDIAQAESDNLVEAEKLADDYFARNPDKAPDRPLAFGWIHDEWVKLKSKMQPDDELWYFRSPEHTWRMMAGREGYAIVRNGEPIDCIVTCLS